MGTKRPRASLFVRARVSVSLIASLLVCGAALPAASKPLGREVRAIQAVIAHHDLAGLRGYESAFASETDADARAWTLRAVGALRRGPKAEAFISAALTGDSSPAVRLAAAQALAVAGGTRAVSGLSAALSSESNGGVRMAIVQALGGLADPGADSALSGALSRDSDSNVRLVAAQELKTRGRDRLLRAALQDSDPRVRSVAGAP